MQTQFLPSWLADALTPSQKEKEHRVKPLILQPTRAKEWTPRRGLLHCCTVPTLHEHLQAVGELHAAGVLPQHTHTHCRFRCCVCLCVCRSGGQYTIPLSGSLLFPLPGLSRRTCLASVGGMQPRAPHKLVEVPTEPRLLLRASRLKFFAGGSRPGLSSAAEPLAPSHWYAQAGPR